MTETRDDDEERQLRRRLRWGPSPAWSIAWTVFAVAWVIGAVVIGQALTSPWPSRGPGGGIGKNVWGPVVTWAVAVAPVLVSGLLVFRRRRS